MNKNTVTAELRTFQKINVKKSLLHVILTALIGYTNVIMAIVIYDKFPIVTYSLSIITFVAFCRAFIIVHDTGHFTLFKNRYHNSIAGNILGFLVMIPNELWSFVHSLHHASVGSLDKRFMNPELITMTTEEYSIASGSKKLLYRAARSKLNRLLITPIILFLVARLPLPKLSNKAKVAVIIYDLIYGGIIYLSIHFNFWMALIIGFALPLFLFHVFASIVFYLQHQFEDTLWLEEKDWNLYAAALEGSSYLNSGPIFQWLTGNNGFHHIHHLNSKIPFYNLPKAHDSVKDRINFKEVHISQIFKHLNGKVWDKQKKKLVHYREI